jgi:hypothetical protein
VLFILTLMALAAVIYIGNQPSVSRNLTIWLILPAVLILRVVVGVYDRWQGGRRGIEQHDEWAEYPVE